MHDAGHVDHPLWSRTLASRRGVRSDCSKQKRELAAMPRPPPPRAQEAAKAARSPSAQHSAERHGRCVKSARRINRHRPRRRLWLPRNRLCAGGSECEKGAFDAFGLRVGGAFLLGQCDRGLTNALQLRIPIALAPGSNRLNRFTSRFEGPYSRQQGVRTTAASHRSR
jgi:hypothetical protein